LRGLAICHHLLGRRPLRAEADLAAIVDGAGLQQVFAEHGLAGHSDQRQVIELVCVSACTSSKGTPFSSSASLTLL
jgi:hypothetical protein